MPTKSEYSTTFNSVLGLDIDWTKLKVEELVQLAVLFNHPQLLLQKLGIKQEGEAGQKRLVEAGIDTLKEIAGNWEGPIARFLRKVIDEPKKETQETP